MDSLKHNLTWRDKARKIIYEADTPLGKLFDVILLIIIVISIILVLLESVPSLGIKYKIQFIVLEWIITIIFSIEYLLRIITVNKPLKYIFSFYGIIDLLSTTPMYLSFFFGGFNSLIALRSLRLLRVFRILKISKYLGEAEKLSTAIKKSAAKISVFLFAVVVLSIMFGTIMYIIEGEENGFTSIPISIYWCIVTLTTVGYGDISPGTPLGQFIAVIIMIMGYGIIAVPTGIVSAEYSQNKNKSNHSTKICDNCLHDTHDYQANYCHKCGSVLND